MTDPATTLEGRMLGPYRILRVIGHGGWGTVYHAMELNLERHVAIKVLLPSVANNKKALKRFVREAKAAAKLVHPNTVTLFQIGQEGKQVYVAMELLEGGTLDQAVSGQSPPDWRQVTGWIADAASGLAAAHAVGIVHRDVKPGNLMLTDQGKVKVVDFGLARLEQAQGMDVTRDGALVGTPAYMSPEQCGGKITDHRSDIYSLGCTYYSLLAGHPPFEADNLPAMIHLHHQEIPPDPRGEGESRRRIPDAVLRVLAFAMQKHPDDRYQSAGDLAEDLALLVGSNDDMHSFEADWEGLWHEFAGDGPPLDLRTPTEGYFVDGYSPSDADGSSFSLSSDFPALGELQSFEPDRGVKYPFGKWVSMLFLSASSLFGLALIVYALFIHFYPVPVDVEMAMEQLQALKVKAMAVDRVAGTCELLDQLQAMDRKLTEAFDQRRWKQVRDHLKAMETGSRRLLATAEAYDQARAAELACRHAQAAGARFDPPQADDAVYRQANARLVAAESAMTHGDYEKAKTDFQQAALQFGKLYAVPEEVKQGRASLGEMQPAVLRMAVDAPPAVQHLVRSFDQQCAAAGAAFQRRDWPAFRVAVNQCRGLFNGIEQVHAHRSDREVVDAMLRQAEQLRERLRRWHDQMPDDDPTGGQSLKLAEDLSHAMELSEAWVQAGQWDQARDRLSSILDQSRGLIRHQHQAWRQPAAQSLAVAVDVLDRRQAEGALSVVRDRLASADRAFADAEFQRARAGFREVVSLIDDAMYHRAVALARQDDVNGALQVVRQMRKLNPGNQRTRLLAEKLQPLLPPANPLGLTMVQISPGTMVMGSPPTERDHRSTERQHPVKLTGRFYISATEVTRRQWWQLMKTRPWSKGSDSESPIQGPDLPAGGISWEQAKAYVAALNKTLSPAQRRHWQYRLPTEAQWEYACRAGSAAAFCYGDAIEQLGDYGWFVSNADRQLHPVAQRQANRWGLFDMHGNVKEWCVDTALREYPKSPDQPVTDPVGVGSGAQRLLRGGSYQDAAWHCRSAFREQQSADTGSPVTGLRVVLMPLR